MDLAWMSINVRCVGDGVLHNRVPWLLTLVPRFSKRTVSEHAEKIAAYEEGHVAAQAQKVCTRPLCETGMFMIGITLPCRLPCFQVADCEEQVRAAEQALLEFTCVVLRQGGVRGG